MIEITSSLSPGPGQTLTNGTLPETVFNQPKEVITCLKYEKEILVEQQAIDMQ